MAKSFQEFRCKGEVIRIETITDSDGQQCVLWRDIRTAFPGLTRIQHGNMFVPIVKDNRFYRYDVSDTNQRLQLSRRGT